MTEKSNEAALHAMGKCLDIMIGAVIMEQYEDALKTAPTRFPAGDIEDCTTLRVRSKTIC